MIAGNMPYGITDLYITNLINFNNSKGDNGQFGPKYFCVIWQGGHDIFGGHDRIGLDLYHTTNKKLPELCQFTYQHLIRKS